MKVINRKCETCKRFFKKNQDDENICGDCSKIRSVPAYSNWEWNGLEDGCDFCNGHVNEFGFCGVEVGYFKIEIWKDEHQYMDSEFYLNVLHILHVTDEENLKINYCPLCGKRL